MSDFSYCKTPPPSDRLLQVIKAQSEIAKIGSDLGVVMSIVAEKAMELTGADGAAIELAEVEEMVYRGVAGSVEAFLGLRLPKESSLSGLCVETGEMLYSKDTNTDDRVDKDACIKVNARSMVVVPLFYAEAPVGVVKVLSKTENFFSDDDICILLLMGETLGAAMYHAEHYAVDELFIRATSDPLTGLLNRAAFFDNLRQLTLLSAYKTSKFCVLMLDMDGLKYINDTYGHKAGDAAIKEFAERIKHIARQNDIVARLGGDEFAVVIADIKDEDESRRVVDRIYERLSLPLEFDGNMLPIAASIGTALFPDDEELPQGLLDIADKRMYETKRKRKNTTV